LRSASLAIRACGDETELHDAVGNLVENALKYAPHSPVDVSLRDDADDVLLEVVDSGPGIAFDEQARIFDRFYRGRDRAEADGFGLGLAIAKRSIERAGGALTLASVPGAGCRFTIRIPRARRGEATVLAV
jgi:signal transduction histidine kinase